MTEYKETIQFNISSYNRDGYLFVKKDSWELKYYCNGPDRRFHSVLFCISNSYVDEYITKFIKAYERMEMLKEKFHNVLSGEFVEEYDGLYIVISGQNNGFVAVEKYYGYHFKISDKNELNDVIGKLKYIKEKANTIQSLLD